jgi:Zn-dependent protease with chaperone function
MFGYFIYYIIALLIYATYQPVDAPLMAPFTVFLLFIALTAAFTLLTRVVFSRIESQIGKTSSQSLDHRFQGALTQQSIIAVAVYAINIYELNLGFFLRDFSLLRAIPTLEALVFLLLFIIYMTIIWSLAHGAHHKIYRTGLSRLQYVFSNISFSIPILLPWLVISISADFIRILPFEAPRTFLDSTGGQISYFFFFLVVIAVMGPALIQKFWGCTPLEAGPTRSRIAALCDMAGMKYRDIMLWPLFGGNMITAGVMGLIRRFRYILVTPALIRHLHPVELDAVIVHEIGHIKKKHLLFYLFFFAAYLILTFSVLDLMLYGLIYLEASYGLLPENGGGSATLISISAGLLMILTFLIYFRFIFGWFMRNFERQADAYALQVMGFARPLISTFEKIAETSGQAPDRPNWHHYSIAERIDFLIKAQADPSAIVFHDRRIRKGILIFLAMVLLFGWLGYGLHFGKTGDTINASFAGAIIEHRLKSEPDNPDLLQFLGDIHYQAEAYKKAEIAYRRAIDIDPDHVRALNNLAWLYATCPDVHMRQPDHALDLALRAAALSTESHVLDTLAEAYYVNGDFKNAVAVGEKALDAAGENYAYYRDQLEKFTTAARK